jgi:ATP-dependent HslUV protease subunit HslV
LTAGSGACQDRLRFPHGLEVPLRPVFRSTTVLCVRAGESVAMASDGQVTLDDTVMKHGARKVRRIHDDTILAGFAGAAADGFALFSRFEEKLDEYRGNFERACVELVREWRTDKALRRLEALLVVADEKRTFLLSGTGDLIEPDDGLAAIGSGGPLAVAAARALTKHTSLSAAEVAREALQIASGIDIYTNAEITVEEL